MTSILTTDVQTYVRERIAKKFGSVKEKREALSKSKESTNTRSRSNPAKAIEGPVDFSVNLTASGIVFHDPLEN